MRHVAASRRTHPPVIWRPRAAALWVALATPCVLAQTTAPAAPATAASAPASAPAPDDESRVITVTAQRRSEQLQKVPLAVTALTAREMEVQQIRRLDDLKVAVPNVVIEQNTGTSSGAKIFMRGVGTDESLFTADPSVAMYIDDVYIARQTGAMFDMFDLQRVEVLRGPQGTLYGRNAPGGAVRYITKVPNGESRLEVDSRVGNLGRADVNLSGGLALSDSTAVSFGLMSKSRDGYLRDITNNRRVNDEDVKGARLAWASALSSSTSLRVAVDLLRQRSGPTYASGIVSPAKAAQFNRPVNNADDDLLTVETNLVKGSNDLDQKGVSFTLSTEMPGFEWRNIVALRSTHNLLLIDFDGTTTTRFHLFQDQSQRQESFESQLVSTGKGPFSWQAGLFRFEEKNTQPTRQDIFTTGGVTTIGQTTAATAVYGQGDLRFGGIWKATAGARYSRESKDFSLSALRANGTLNFDYADSKTFTRTDWKLGLDAQVTNNVMVYGSAATGFKSGGFNGRAGNVAAAQLTLLPETVLTYELGVKSTLLGGALRLNANVFQNDYKDLQLTAFNSAGVAVLSNAASAKISGVEIDAAVDITKGWAASVNVGTLDAEYKDFSANNAAIFSGKSLKQAPKLQYGLSTNVRTPVAGGTLVAAAQMKFVDAHYQNLAASELIKTDAYTLVDARLGWEAANNRWAVSLWGRNLTDKRYTTGGFDLGALGIAVGFINVPRTYGLDLRYRFW